MDELQELREQMAALKEKLNKQQIVTEQNLRQLIRKKIQNWRVFFIVWTILMPLFIYGEYMYYDSWFRTIAWGMFFVIWLCTNLYTFLSLNNKNIMSGNVTELLSKMQRLKRIEKGPMVLLGFVFFMVLSMGEDFVELRQKYPFGKYHLLLLAVGLGFVVLFWVAWKFIIQKRPSQWDEYIRQLEEISKSEQGDEEKIEM